MDRVKALVHVVDGDTVDLDWDLGFSLVLRQRVRLHGTDTPEGHAIKGANIRPHAGRRLLGGLTNPHRRPAEPAAGETGSA